MPAYLVYKPNSCPSLHPLGATLKQRPWHFPTCRGKWLTAFSKETESHGLFFVCVCVCVCECVLGVCNLVLLFSLLLFTFLLRSSLWLTHSPPLVTPAMLICLRFSCCVTLFISLVIFELRNPLAVSAWSSTKVFVLKLT